MEEVFIDSALGSQWLPASGAKSHGRKNGIHMYWLFLDVPAPSEDEMRGG